MEKLVLLCFVIMAAISWSCGDEKLAASCAYDGNRPVIQLPVGRLGGFVMTTVSGKKVGGFQAIPYAKPPLGNLRFEEPEPAGRWKGTLDGSRNAPRCIQLDSLDNFKLKGQEDCLYLNVYTPRVCPAGGQPLPVMVWFHGGFWFHKAGSIYGPRYLLDEGKVVLVTVNYRLGPFGFLTSGDPASPGNQGLKDQVLALKWVRDNIHYFGGNPKSVTIFGGSVGGASVELHIVSPLSRGLFHRAIAQSGSSFCYWGVIRNGREVGVKTAGLFGCPTTSSSEMVQCLRNVSAVELVTAETQLSAWYGPVAVFGPTIEPEGTRAYISKPVEAYYKAGEAASVPLIAGVNQNEGGFTVFKFIRNATYLEQINTNWTGVGPLMLGLQDDPKVDEKLGKIWEFYMGGKDLSWETRLNFSNLYGDRTFMECSLDGLLAHRKYTGAPVYAYDLTYQGRFSSIQTIGGNPKDWGVVHVDELIYLLNDPDAYAVLSEGDPELGMSRVMTNFWTHFAETGSPGPSSYERDWRVSTRQFTKQPMQELDNGNILFLNLTLNPEMIRNPFLHRYQFWKQL